MVQLQIDTTQFLPLAGKEKVKIHINTQELTTAEGPKAMCKCKGILQRLTDKHTQGKLKFHTHFDFEGVTFHLGHELLYGDERERFLMLNITNVYTHKC